MLNCWDTTLIGFHVEAEDGVRSVLVRHILLFVVERRNYCCFHWTLELRNHSSWWHLNYWGLEIWCSDRLLNGKVSWCILHWDRLLSGNYAIAANLSDVGVDSRWATLADLRDIVGHYRHIWRIVLLRLVWLQLLRSYEQLWAAWTYLHCCKWRNLMAGCSELGLLSNVCINGGNSRIALMHFLPWASQHLGCYLLWRIWIVLRVRLGLPNIALLWRKRWIEIWWLRLHLRKFLTRRLLVHMLGLILLLWLLWLSVLALLLLLELTEGGLAGQLSNDFVARHHFFGDYISIYFSLLELSWNIHFLVVILGYEIWFAVTDCKIERPDLWGPT